MDCPAACVLQDGLEFGDDDTVVIYNRVPKTGSTTLAGIMYNLCSTNKYYVIHIGMFHSAKTIALSDQVGVWWLLVT